MFLNYCMSNSSFLCVRSVPLPCLCYALPIYAVCVCHTFSHFLRVPHFHLTVKKCMNLSCFLVFVGHCMHHNTLCYIHKLCGILPSIYMSRTHEFGKDGLSCSIYKKKEKGIKNIGYLFRSRRKKKDVACS